MLSTLTRRFFSLLAPPKTDCVYCHNPTTYLASRLGLCASCYRQIPWIRKVRCHVCGRYEECRDCGRRQVSYFVMNRSAVQYDDRMKDLLARYKYRGDERLRDLLSDMLSYAFHLLQQDVQSTNSAKQSQSHRVITYVPLSAERMAERGFNQSEQLARDVASKLNIPVVPILIRNRHTDKQSFKSRSDRLADLENVFSLDPQFENQFLNLQHTRLEIFIIDDVYTTGSTLNQCARMIKSQLSMSEGPRIYGLTWAR